ncbi:class I SAM-dependent methyltransferase [Amycolatopsis sp.]|uniref:class I SAM-dependent DNA methyltransferase n=1 Tax=Amycolatopsis sp. TaxID=37632 RepID=UPI002DFDA537|nr:class I SAM-dependent methyltransferase [Amycolatopsis sp.]
MTEPSYLNTTRIAYDTVAADYAELLRDNLAESPLDRAMLGAFADRVKADGNGEVGDLGCGPGRVTEHLHSLGLNAFGVDLSPGMIAVARSMYPDLRFDEGLLTALDIKDAALGGVVAWYSIIHTPPELLPKIFAEFARVLAPGGQLLMAFQVGENERRHIQQAYGHELSAYAYRLSPDHITDLLSKVGIVVDARLVREPGELEKTPQAYLLARKTGE